MQNVQTFPSAGFIWLFYIKHNLFPFLLASDIFATFATYTILVYDITDTDCWAQNYNALMVMFVTSLMYRVLGTKLQCTSGHVYDITIQMLGTKLQCTRGHVCDITDTDCWAQNCNALGVMFVQLSNVDFQETGWEIVWKKEIFFWSIFCHFYWYGSWCCIGQVLIQTEEENKALVVWTHTHASHMICWQIAFFDATTETNSWLEELHVSKRKRHRKNAKAKHEWQTKWKTFEINIQKELKALMKLKK